MSTAKDDLPFVGRQAIIDALFLRLQHPDDLRDNPDKFICPGFFGIAGTGKSRLLREVELRGQSITPYVVRVDFEPRTANVTPRTPQALLRYLIDLLEEQDLNSRPIWRRIFWRWSNPFKQCRQIIQQNFVTTISQNINISGSRTGDITQEIDLGSKIPDNLSQAFQTAIVNLYDRRETKRLFGDFGITQQLPLVLILLDTIDLAPRPIREGLDELRNVIAGKNTLRFHFMFVITGRERLEGVIDTALPPFDVAEAKQFVEVYASFRLQQSKVGQQQRQGFEKLIKSKTAQEKLVSRAQGIPVVLQLLVDTVALSSQANIQMDHLPGEHDLLVRFVIENYLERLEAQASKQDDPELWLHYYLLLYSAVPRLIPSSGFLRAVFNGLQEKFFNAHSNYDELFQDLAQESFITRGEDRELIMHSLIRDGICSYLMTNDAERFKEIHQRAEKWFQAHNDLPNYFYHRLYSDYAAGFAELKTALSKALLERRWLDVQALIAVAASVTLDESDKLWIEFYKAELAWSDNNQPLALDRLRKLYDVDIPSLREEVAGRLEAWLGFNYEIELKLSRGETPEVSQEHLDDLLAWADIRNQLRVKTYALRTLGTNEFTRKNYDRARESLKRCAEIAVQTQDHQTRAFAMQLLGEIALIVGPLADASHWLRESCKLYASLSERQKQAVVQVLLATAIFNNGEFQEVRRLMEDSLSIQQNTNDRIHQADTLRVLWLMSLRSLEIATFPGADDALNKLLRCAEEASDLQRQAQAWSLEAEMFLATQGTTELSDWERVLRYLEGKALESYHQTGDKLGEAGSYLMLGIVEASTYSQPEHFELALVHLKQARSLYRAEHDRLSKAHTQVVVGAISYVVGQRNSKILAESNEAFDEALEIYQQREDQKGQGAVLFILGQIALLDLEYEQARAHFERALEFFASHTDPVSQFLITKTEELLQRVVQEVGPPNKHIQHLIFPFRVRVIDLYGWSSVLRREFESVYRIFDLEQSQINQQSLGTEEEYTTLLKNPMRGISGFSF